MATLSQYLEGVDSVSPGTASCSIESGRATLPYYLLGPNIGESDIQGAFAQILGATTDVNPGGSAKLNRLLPLAHPMFPFWFATGISGLRGLGKPTQIAADPDLEAAPFPTYALYPNYELTVEFSPLPYAVRPDSVIAVSSGTWAPPPPASGDQFYQYAPEWQRFTDFEFVSKNDTITATQGLMRFKTGSNAEPGDSGGRQFPAMPKMPLPNSIFRVYWYGVPIRYILSPNSYLRKYRGMVNQIAWWTFQGKTLFQPGELLYLGFQPTKTYTSPFAQLMGWTNGDQTMAKYVNLAIDFLYTVRQVNDAPAAAHPNYIVAGHNLNPYFPKRLFYYTVFDDKNNTNAPAWFSFPVELLFTDPDA